jgi:F-type H+-transporting ATPase subunit gamma
MEMVAASKMRKAQERMRAGRPYATKVREIAAHLMQANPDWFRRGFGPGVVHVELE